LFTIDEETGMTGALNLKGGILQGEILLNLDTKKMTKANIILVSRKNGDIKVPWLPLKNYGKHSRAFIRTSRSYTNHCKTIWPLAKFVF
jgi:hypothetical protein